MNENNTNSANGQSLHVYQAINQVQAAMAKEGIAKNHRNTQGQGYNFRGVDDVMNALAGHLAEAKLMILPRAVSRECVERESKAGGALFYTIQKIEFDFVSAVDGSKHTVCTFGEAMDSSDKSTNKSASAAFKYACFQAFCIPTAGDNDADATTPEPKAKPAPKRQYTVKEEPSEPTTWTGKVSDVKERSGTSKKTGKPWTCYDVILEDGKKASTFDRGLADGIPTDRLVEVQVKPGHVAGSFELLDYQVSEDEPSQDGPPSDDLGF